MVQGAHVGISHRFRLTRHFTGQAGECTSFAAVTMLRAQIVGDNGPNCLALRSGFRCCEHPPRKSVLEHRAGGLRDQLVLAIEVCIDRKSTRLNSSHLVISYAVFCLKKKKKINSAI